MSNRIKYFSLQGLFNLKNSYLVIIAFSLTISMVSGLFFYSVSYKTNLLEDHFSEIIDFDFIYSESTLNPAKAYGNNDYYLQNKIEQLNINFDDIVYYSSFNSEFAKEFFNASQFSPKISSKFNESLSLDLSVYVMDVNFFLSKRFSEFFTITSGTFPNSEDEILIDYSFAQLWNCDIGDNVNFTIRKSKAYSDYYLTYLGDTELYPQLNKPYYENDDYFYMAIPLKVSGIFISNSPTYKIGQEEFSRDYDWKKNFRTNDIEINHFSKAPIFCYYNYETRDHFHPIMQMINDVDREFDRDHIPEVSQMKFGKIGLYDRDIIKFANLAEIANSVEEEVYPLKTDINRDYRFLNYFSNDLRQIYQKISFFRSISLSISIPITLFAIFLGLYARKTEIEARLEEFLLLRSKGASGYMILLQYLFECLFLGTVVTIIGILLGLLNFHLFKGFFSRIFNYEDLSSIQFALNFDTLGKLILISYGITIFGSISGIQYIIKIPISKILSLLESEELDVRFDEKTLFENNKATKKKADEKENKTKLKEKETQTIKNNLFLLRKSMQQVSLSDGSFNVKKNKLYENPIDKKNKKIRKLSGILIFFSFIPVLLTGFIYMYYLIDLPESILEILQLLINSNVHDIFIYFMVISPIFIILGIFRIILKEKPRIFAKISRKITKSWMRNRSFLVGMEMIKQRQLQVIMVILSLFVSSYSYINIYANTNIRHAHIIDNFQVGGDIQVQLSGYNPNASSIAQIQNFEKNILDFKLSSLGTPVFNNIVSIYYENNNEFHPKNRFVYYFDVQKYLDIISENHKPEPYPGYFKDIQNYLGYTHGTHGINHSIHGILVNNVFLNNYDYHINDEFNLNHQYYEEYPQKVAYTNYTVKIIGVLDILPGFTLGESTEINKKEIIIFDDYQINYASNESLPSRKVIELIDVNNAKISDENQKVLQNYLYEASNNSVRFENFKFYNNEWNSPSLNFEENALGFYLVFYIDFLIIGVFIAIALAIILINVQKKNKYFNGILLARGFGKIGIVKLILSELFIIFSISYILGTIFGLGFSLLSVYFAEFKNSVISGIHLPIYFNFTEFFFLTGGILITTVFFTLLSYFIQIRQSISKFIHKF